MASFEETEETVTQKLKVYPAIIGFTVILILLVRGELSAQGAGSLTYGQTVNGSTGGSGTENWTFSGSASDVVVIDMKSAEFDTYLELRGPDGVLLTSDDDGGGDLDSQIIRGLQESGLYTITAGGFGDERGAYTLSLNLATDFATRVENALAAANVPAGTGFLAEGLSETIVDLTEEDETVQWVNLDGEFADFAMGADITWGPGAAEDTCGFIFRRVDDDNYYVVEIDRSGAVWFVERDEGEWGDSQGDNYLAVRTSAKDVNQVVLSASGDTFIVYVNGQRTATFSDISNPSGQVAVEMTTYDESTVTNCTFNDVWVWSLGPAAPAIATATPAALPTLPGATQLPTLPGPNVRPSKTPVAGLTTGQSPIISSVTSRGTCDDLTFDVSWSDPDGDAVRIEWLDSDTSEVVFTDNISGGSGTFSSPDWFCESDSCVTNARVVDAAGNMSSVFEVTTTCP
jgi:hypothetical protein